MSDIEDLLEIAQKVFGEDISISELTHDELVHPKFQHITQEGGGEGGSEYCFTVIKLDGVFYKIEYQYYSHIGYDMDYARCFVVTPTQKTVTVYE